MTAVVFVVAHYIAASPVSSGLDRLINALESPLARISYGFGIILGVKKFFKEVEDELADSVKQRMAQWLLRPRTTPFQSWSSTFIDMFDTVFTSRHYSLKCFLRSCLASYAAVAITGLLWLVFRVPLMMIFGRARVGAAGSLWMFLGFALFANVFPDYLSLLKTRKLLSLMRNSGALRRMFLLVLDFTIAYIIATVTTVIAFTFMFAFYAPLQPGISRWSYEFTFSHLGGFFWQMLSYHLFSLRVPRWGVFSVMWFIPAFFASIWVWLYVGSGVLVRAVHHLDSVRVLMSRILNVENGPLRSVGLIAGLILALIYWTVLILAKAA
jgi:hypothetical protein